jgi:organic radical activating enzyme
MSRLKLFNVTWQTTTAGPSPCQNNRTEVFLFGCERAKNGNPCKGCFNPKLWDNSIAERDYSPSEMAEQIAKFAPNKYVTIGGGEPTDQMEGLIELCKLLKKKGFHIMVYTWHSLKDIFESTKFQDLATGLELAAERDGFRKLLYNIDILVDGQFQLEERLYQEEKDDGLLNSVGSGNQIIWDLRQYNNSIWPSSVSVIPYIDGYCLRNIDALHIKDNGDLVYILKDINQPAEIVHIR